MTSGSVFSVNKGGFLRMSAAQRGQAELAGVSAAGTNLVVRFSSDKAATGTGQYVYALGRVVPGAGTYGAVVKIAAGGAVSVGLSRRDAAGVEHVLAPGTAVAGLSAPAGTVLLARVEVFNTGTTTLKARVWAASKTEPATWPVSATDTTAEMQSAGRLGVGGYLSGTSTNAPVTVKFLALSASTLPASYVSPSPAPTSTPTASPTPTPAPTLTVPATPAGVAVVAGDTQASVSWPAVSGATSYRVYRDGSQVAAQAATAFTDTGLVNGTRYAYTVAAVNSAGSSAQSAPVFATPALPMPAGWTTVLFSDEFSGSAVDTAKWNVRNSTTQSNTNCRNFSRNVTVASGVLSIRSGTDNTVDAAAHPWTCGYIDSIGKFSVQNGYWEARLRFPWGSAAQGYWPAFWLRPDDAGIGEIDIMEAWAGNRADVHQTLWRDYTGTPHVQDSNNTSLPGFDPTAWHTYAVQKEAGVMKFFVDGVQVWDATDSATWRSEAFDRSIGWNIRINLQVGSSWGGNPDAGTDLARTYDLDYVRVLGR